MSRQNADGAMWGQDDAYFVTLIGYQSGAKQFAGHYGIALKELRVPTADDWNGRVKDVILKISVVTPMITAFQPRVSQKYLSSLNEPTNLQIGLMTHDPIIFDADGHPVASHEQLRGKLPNTGVSCKSKTHFWPFPGHTLRVGNHNIDIDGVDITYDVNVETSTSKLLGEQMAHAIILDVQSGTYTFIDKTGKVRLPRN